MRSAGGIVHIITPEAMEETGVSMDFSGMLGVFFRAL